MPTTTGLPDPNELAQAINDLGAATGYAMWGSRLALARGDVALAHRCYLEHQRLIGNRTMPKVGPDVDHHDGLDPAELLRREAQLTPGPDDTKRGRR